MPSGQQTGRFSTLLVPLGFEQVTAGLGAAQNLPNVPEDAQMALIQPLGGTLSWRDDGTAPTAGVGMVIAQNDAIQYAGSLDVFQFISASGVTAVNISYYQYG